MADVFGQVLGTALGAMFDTFAVTVTYRPRYGQVTASLPAVEVPIEIDTFASGGPDYQDGRRFDIRVADLADEPRIGDEIRTGTGKRYVVQKPPEHDLRRRIWLVYAYEEPA